MARTKTLIRCRWALFLAIFHALLEPVNSSEVGLYLKHHTDGFLFLDSKHPVLFYQLTPKSLNGQSKRSNYIHPLYGLNGEILTEDFPADHLHHRGIFWGWHQVLVNGRKVSNSWLNNDFRSHVIEAKPISTGDRSVALQVQSQWMSPALTNMAGAQEPFLDEITTVRVHPVEENLRKIDFVIYLSPLIDGLSLGGSEDDKGYGGFSIRTRLPKDIRFLGFKGVLKPRRKTLRAGPWVDLTASFGNQRGQLAGIAILCHPSLPGFPQPWILRSAMSMQNPSWPGSTPTNLTKGRPLTFRYRLIIHRGNLSRENLKYLHKEYSQPPW